MLADTGSFASYRLLQSGTYVGLHRKVPGWTCGLQLGLMAMEDEMLARRCVHGWNVSSAELMQVDGAHVAQSVRDVIGDFDPAILATGA